MSKDIPSGSDRSGSPTLVAEAPAQTPGDADRFIVKVPSIEPRLPPQCCACLREDPDQTRRLVFRRSDGTVERVCAVYWPYCESCLLSLASLDRQQRWMTVFGFLQTAIVVYAVGGAIGWYDFYYSSLGALAVFFVAFWYFAKKARALWGLEWARIDDVYKGGIGAAFSFRNREYAQRFADVNADIADGPTDGTGNEARNAANEPPTDDGGATTAAATTAEG